MLVVTSKKYEVEEIIKAENEQGETIYEFTMQITPDEMGELKNILIDKNYELSKIDDEEKVFVEATKMQEDFENIVFKNHKDKFKEVCGLFKYNEMVDLIYAFFMNAFIDKKLLLANTINSKLQKVMKH